MSSYLVMRRTMTGSWEDCTGPVGKIIEAKSPGEAQEIVGDGAGVYRVIADDPGVVVYVEVEYVASRSVSDVAPPPDPAEAEAARLARAIQDVRLPPQRLTGGFVSTPIPSACDTGYTAPETGHTSPATS